MDPAGADKRAVVDAEAEPDTGTWLAAGRPMRRCDLRPPAPPVSSFCGPRAVRATPAAPRLVIRASRPGRAAVCDAHSGHLTRWGAWTVTGNLKDSTELEVTGLEPANRDAVPAEQLSVRCALGPQAKGSPEGPGLELPLHEEERG